MPSEYLSAWPGYKTSHREVAVQVIEPRDSLADGVGLMPDGAFVHLQPLPAKKHPVFIVAHLIVDRIPVRAIAAGISEAVEYSLEPRLLLIA